MALRTADPRVRALAPAAVYLAVRLTGVAVLTGMTGGRIVDALHAWDGNWLLAIAEHGYGGVPDDHLDAFGNHTPETPLAFFPGYPSLVGVLAPLVGLYAAGIVVSLAAGIVAAYGLARLATLVPGGSERAGLLLVALFAAEPMAVVLSMTYTEALFTALAVWALVHVLQRNWVAAGLCAAAAGLVRPSSVAVITAVGLAALVAVLHRRDSWRPWVGAIIATTGLLGYLGFVALVTGEPTGWFRIQHEGWNTGVDGGAATARFMARALADGEQVYDIATVLAFVGSIVLLVVAIRARLPWPLIAYTAVMLLLVWATRGPGYDKIRLLVPAFPLLLPIAVGLARRRTGTAVAVVVATALASAWFGGYALTIWHYGI